MKKYRADVVILLLILLCAAVPLQSGESLPDPDHLVSIRHQLENNAFDQVVIDWNIWCLRNKPLIDENTSLGAHAAWLKSYAYDEKQIRSPLLTERDKQYLHATTLLRQIALNVIDESETDSAKAERLFRFVTDEVLPYVPSPYPFEQPLDVLIRGHGSCDQAAWALTALADTVGLRGLIVFLRHGPDEESHHTVAALQVDGAWRLYDPFAGLDFSDDGDPADLMKVLADPTTLVLPDGPGECLVNADDLPWSTLYVYANPRGGLLRWNLFERFITEGRLPPLWSNPIPEVLSLRQSLRSMSKTGIPLKRVELLRSLQVEPWHLIGRLEQYYSSPTYLKRIANAGSHSPLRRGRLLYLQGKYEEALASFRKTELVEENGGGLIVDRYYFEARALQALGRYEEALNLYKQVLESDRERWEQTASWNYATCLHQAGRTKEAKTVLSDMPEPRTRSAATKSSISSQDQNGHVDEQ